MNATLEYSLMSDIYDACTTRYAVDYNALEGTSYQLFIKGYAGNDPLKKISGTIIYLLSKLIALFAKIGARIYTAFTSLTGMGYTTGNRKLDNKIADLGIEAARNAVLVRAAMKKRWKDTMGVIDNINATATKYAKMLGKATGKSDEEIAKTEVDILKSGSIKSQIEPFIQQLGSIKDAYNQTVDKVGDQDTKLLNLEKFGVIGELAETFKPWVKQSTNKLEWVRDRLADARDGEGAKMINEVMGEGLGFFAFMVPKSGEGGSSSNNS